MSEDNSEVFGLLMPFWIDTDAYTDRDRAMFVAGVEFEQVTRLLKDGWIGERPVHRENESRLRMAAARLKRTVAITPQGDEFPEWSFLVALPAE